MVNRRVDGERFSCRADQRIPRVPHGTVSPLPTANAVSLNGLPIINSTAAVAIAASHIPPACIFIIGILARKISQLPTPQGAGGVSSIFCKKFPSAMCSVPTVTPKFTGKSDRRANVRVPPKIFPLGAHLREGEWVAGETGKAMTTHNTNIIARAISTQEFS